MTNGDWIRSMTDIELAQFFEMLLSERDAIISKRLSEQGIECSVVSVPALSVSRHLEFLKRDFNDAGE